MLWVRRLSLFVAACSIVLAPLSAWPNEEPTLPEEGGYQLPPLVDARQILPPELLKGEHFEVNLVVSTYGFSNSYNIAQRFGHSSRRVLVA